MDNVSSPPALTPEPTGAILWLWLVAAVAGNAFAAYWLLKALSAQLPDAKHALRGCLSRFWACRRSATPPPGEDAKVRIDTLAAPQSSAQGANVKSRATWPQPSPAQKPALATRSVGHEVELNTSLQSAIEVVDAALAARRISLLSMRSMEGQVAEPQSSIGSPAAASSHESTAAFAAVKRLYTGGYTTSPQHPTVTQAATSLEWRNLSFSLAAKPGDSSKLLLKGVWGSVHSGQLLAIMGPSGAGKSTLLELLAMRRSAAQSDAMNGAAQSSLLLDGTPATQAKLKEASSYIPQEDALLPQMTVGEVLALHATLRLPESMSHEERQGRQDAVLEAMGLTRQKDTLTGGELPGGLLLRGLSGGERKRLALSAGLLQGPRLLFADEPTSGLDAFAALTVMAHLSTMAQGPYACAVVVTIHQPRAAIWDMIDKVLLLAQGHMMFEGSTLFYEAWFSEHLPPLLGLPAHIPPFQCDPEQHGSVSDWAMDLVSLSDAAMLNIANAARQGAGEEAQQEVQRGVHLEEKQSELLQIQSQETGVVPSPEVGTVGTEEELARRSGSKPILRKSSMRATWVATASAHFLNYYLRRRRSAVLPGAWPGTSHSTPADVPTTASAAVHPGCVAVRPADVATTGSAAGLPSGAAGPIGSTAGVAGSTSVQGSATGSGSKGAFEGWPAGPEGCGSPAGCGENQAGESASEGGNVAHVTASDMGSARDRTSTAGSTVAELQTGHHMSGGGTTSSTPASTGAIAGSAVHDPSLASTELAMVVGDCATPTQHTGTLTSSFTPQTHTGATMPAAAAAVTEGKQSDIASDADLSCTGKAKSAVVKTRGAFRHAAAEWWLQCRALVWREAVAATRNPTDVAGRMLTFVWVAMLGNFLLYGGGHMGDNAGSIRTRYVWLYFVLFFYLVMPFLFMSVFSADKRYYLADVAAGLYTPGPYYVAKLVASLPINLLISTAYVLTAYGMFGFRHSALSVVQTTAVCAVFSLVCLQWIFFAMAISPNQDIAFILSVAFAVVSLLINSMFIGPMQSPAWPWVGKLRYISPMDYGWQAVMTAEMHDRYFDCSGTDQGALGLEALGLTLQFIPPTPSLNFLRGGLKTERYDCVVSGNIVLEYFGVVPKVWQHFLALLAYLAVLHVATFAALRWATYRATSGQKGNVVVG